MQKLTLAPIVLSLLTITLTGCGDGEDSIFGSGGGNSNNNEFTLSSFEGNATNIARINEKYHA